jgi:hypothetical protein
MHLIGRSIKVWAVTPATDTIPLINIPSWDFMWQGSYNFQRIQKIPAGSVLYSSDFYDNNTANPYNPTNPPKNVFLGENTTDEMMLVYFSFTPYMNGDENIILDSTLLSVDNPTFKDLVKSPQLYEPYPNPASDKMTVEYYLPENQQTVFRMVDIKGALVKEMDASAHLMGLNKMEIDLRNFATGQYIMQMISGGISREKKLIVE